MHLESGRAYFARVESVRHRLAGLAYVARFERLVETLNRDNFRLRSEYPSAEGLAAVLGVSRRMLSSVVGRPDGLVRADRTCGARTTMTPRSALVIGAGIGGLTAAIHLQRAGLQVTVVEKNPEPGGRCGRLVRDGHWFDTGPTLLVMPLVYGVSSARNLPPPESELEAGRSDLSPGLRRWHGSHADLRHVTDACAARGHRAGSFRRFRRYLEEGGRHYQLVVDKIVNRDFWRPSDSSTCRCCDSP